MLELIKELCKPKDKVATITSSPSADQIVNTAFPGNSGSTHQAWKRKKCQFAAYGNKFNSFCQNCGKVYCGKHTSEKVAVVKCKNCED